MDSGAGWPGYGWQLVMPGIAKLTRACWYDRAGYGWSDPAPRNRSAADVANDLHSLLHSAGIRPPYLLVGHSLGGFHVRVFAARYATEVAGLVLVDSADEYEERMHPGIIPEPLMPVVAQLFRFGVHAGILRLVDNGVEAPEGLLPLRDTLIVHALQLQPKSFDASLNEGLSRPETLRQVKAVKSLGNIPLLVLTGAKKPELQVSDEPEAELLNRFMEHRVHVTQAHLAALSTRGRQIILPNVGHGIPTEAPAAIVDAVRDLISLEHEKVEVRSNSH
jgi:pimeloyl-ACP methyl ester carboxylesterase